MACCARPFNRELLVKLAPVDHARQAIQKNQLAHHVRLKFQCEMCLDPRPHHGGVDRFGYEVYAPTSKPWVSSVESSAKIWCIAGMLMG